MPKKDIIVSVNGVNIFCDEYTFGGKIEPLGFFWKNDAVIGSYKLEQYELTFKYLLFNEVECYELVEVVK